MFAVIRAGGKQHKVAKGDVIEVELIKDGSETLQFTPLIVMDDKGKVRTGSDASKALVSAKVVGESRGPKIEVMHYRNKTGYRRHNGHRQRYTTLEISDIKLTGGKKQSEEAGDGS